MTKLIPQNSADEFILRNKRPRVTAGATGSQQYQTTLSLIVYIVFFYDFRTRAAAREEAAIHDGTAGPSCHQLEMCSLAPGPTAAALITSSTLTPEMEGSLFLAPVRPLQ